MRWDAVRYSALYFSSGFSLGVNFSKDQSRRFQGSVDLANFHIYSTVFHADSRGAIRFS